MSRERKTTMDDKALNKMLKAIITAVDYDHAKSLYGNAWEGTKAEKKAAQAELRDIARAHMAK